MGKSLRFTSVKLIFRTICVIGGISLFIIYNSFALQPSSVSGITSGKLPEIQNSAGEKKQPDPTPIATDQQADSGIQAKNEAYMLSDTANSDTVLAEIGTQSALNQEKKIEQQLNENSSLFSRLLGYKNVIDAKNHLILYVNEHFPPFFKKFFTGIIEKTYNYPIIILFILLIFIFVLNLIVVLLVLYYSNRQKNQKERYVRIYTGMYEDVLRSYLFYEIDWPKTLIKLKRIKKPLNRTILTAVLTNFQENLSGEMDNRIPEIYEKLNLYKDAVKMTKSSLYYNKVRGIRELTNLYPKGAIPIIDNFINDKHYLVRAEAQRSFIRIHTSQPFEFFKTLTTPFTRWTQLSAFYLFRLHQLPAPAFIEYLDTENVNVRNFCLRMIIYFQQLEGVTEIFRFLDSKNEQTRFLTFRAINDLRLFEGKELIKNCYPGETGKNRLEIIKAFKNIGTADDFDFLESIIKTGSITEKTEACRALYFMNKAGSDQLNLLIMNSDQHIEQYLAHVTDPRN
ncbi:MAG: hypothetical protein K0M50_17450 [Prolixibacteraceae bacterium]|nr:hypothetical protein [Prolixibacteraceae bacterium]